MVSKKFNESDVRVMFNSFGTIEECTVLRDTNGVSKGNLPIFYRCKSSAFLWTIRELKIPFCNAMKCVLKGNFLCMGGI